MAMIRKGIFWGLLFLLTGWMACCGDLCWAVKAK